MVLMPMVSVSVESETSLDRSGSYHGLLSSSISVVASARLLWVYSFSHAPHCTFHVTAHDNANSESDWPL